MLTWLASASSCTLGANSLPEVLVPSTPVRAASVPASALSPAVVWRLAIITAALSLAATCLNVARGEPLSAQVVGVIGACLALFGTAWYIVGKRFPGALSTGAGGGWAGLLGGAFSVTVLSGFLDAVQLRLSPALWSAGAVISLSLYVVLLLLGATLSFWGITEVVLRDRARKSHGASALAADPEPGPEAGVQTPASNTN